MISPDNFSSTPPQFQVIHHAFDGIRTFAHILDEEDRTFGRNIVWCSAETVEHSHVAASQDAFWPVPDDSTYGGGIYIRAVYRKECRGDIMNMDPPLLLQRDGVPWEHGVRQNHCIEISCGAQ